MTEIQTYQCWNESLGLLCSLQLQIGDQCELLLAHSGLSKNTAFIYIQQPKLYRRMMITSSQAFSICCVRIFCQHNFHPTQTHKYRQTESILYWYTTNSDTIYLLIFLTVSGFLFVDTVFVYSNVFVTSRLG